MTIKTTIKKSRTCERNLAPRTPEPEGGKGKPRSGFPQQPGEASPQHHITSHNITAFGKPNRNVVASPPQN